MSHGRERKEKNCLNCGTMVEGPFCQVCGQQNVEPKETFWGMFTHFFNDITHFDGKFFVTLKDLLFKPGFLSAEYMKGRRASYLNPVRMYVFTSALFFLIFFSLRKPADMINVDGDAKPLTPAKRERVLAQARRDLKFDSTDQNALARIELLKDSTRPVTRAQLEQLEDFNVITTIGTDYQSLASYDSAQAAAPEEKRDGWLKNLWNRKALKLNDKYKKNGRQSMETVIDVFLHNLPYLLFASLPFFALILKLLYVRRRKEFYYADHGIFSIHHYVFSFILLLILILFDSLDKKTGWGIWHFLTFATMIAWPVHLFLAMKRFYGQRKIKTFFKFALLNLLGFIVLIILFLVFALLSVFQL